LTLKGKYIIALPKASFKNPFFHGKKRDNSGIDF